MTLPDSVTYPSREAWLADRCNWLGASEVAAALGLSCYRDATPFRVWRSKADPDAVAPLTGEHLDWGHRLESAIVARFAEGRPGLVQSGATFAHPVHPLVRGTPDAVLVEYRGDDGWCALLGVDAKNLSWRRLARDPADRRPDQFGEPGTDQMPVDYVVQGLIYADIFDLPAWHFACLFGGQTYHEFVVRREGNEATIAALLARACEWWDTYVVGGQHPPLDGSDSAREFLGRLWPTNIRPLLEPTPQARELAQMSARARATIKRAEAEQASADNALRALIGDADGIDGLATWRQAKGRTRTDWEAVARAAGASPALVSQHTTQEPGSRRFLLTLKEE